MCQALHIPCGFRHSPTALCYITGSFRLVLDVNLGRPETNTPHQRPAIQLQLLPRARDSFQRFPPVMEGVHYELNDAAQFWGELDEILDPVHAAKTEVSVETAVRNFVRFAAAFRGTLQRVSGS